MWSCIARRALMVGLSLVPLLAPGLSQPAQAAPAPGQDVCPEPNDTFQAACYLGPGADADGFISNANDVDAYRIEVLDFNTDVHVEMKTPVPYQVELADWNGNSIADSSPNQGLEVIDATAPIPGSYYLFVHSRSGASSDSRPYTLSRSLAYPGSKIPDILYSSEFRQGAREATTGESDFAVHSADGGKYTIAMKIPGSPDDPSQAWWTGFGPELTDFTMTVDARITNGADAGAKVFFRYVDDSNTYFVAVDAKDGQVAVGKVVNGETFATDWESSDAVDTSGGVNRIVIRAFHDQILVNVNGQDIDTFSDTSFNKGYIGIGVMTWGIPATMNFDNIIITTPTEG
jgi:hypothetical protein